MEYTGKIGRSPSFAKFGDFSQSFCRHIRSHSHTAALGEHGALVALRDIRVSSHRSRLVGRHSRDRDEGEGSGTNIEVDIAEIMVVSLADLDWLQEDPTDAFKKA